MFLHVHSYDFNWFTKRKGIVNFNKMEKIISFSYCSVILLFIPATYSMDILKMDFKIWEEKCLSGKAVRSFILHLKCQDKTVNSEDGIEDSCIVRPFHSETVSNNHLGADNASIESICQMWVYDRLRLFKKICAKNIKKSFSV